jgi:hypothetical protein
LTEKGISEAQKVMESKTENVGCILRSIDELPTRLNNYCPVAQGKPAVSETATKN